MQLSAFPRLQRLYEWLPEVVASAVPLTLGLPDGPRPAEVESLQSINSVSLGAGAVCCGFSISTKTIASSPVQVGGGDPRHPAESRNYASNKLPKRRPA